MRPENAAQLVEALRSCVVAAEPVEIIGTGSKRGLGAPVQAPRCLDLSGLRGATVYEPAELVLTAPASMPIAALAALLTEAGQALAFEPPDYGPLLGGAAGQGTLGGIIATNLSGPRRLRAGAARDHVLGCQAVSGRAEAFVAGGKVVKNVTGYDLPKLLAGSYGTLAVLTEITVRALPAPPCTATLVLDGLDDATAIRAMGAALGGPCEVSGAAHLPADCGGVTLLRLEGVRESVADRAASLGGALAGFGTARLLDDAASRAQWEAVRDVAPFIGGDAPVWRISAPPAQGAEVVARLRAAGLVARAFYDWGGGLIWLEAVPGAAPEAIRAALLPCGGHAMLLRAPAPMRAAWPVFQPQPPALAALAARVRKNFDPLGLLNPGRMGS